jgi:hypothetical protein
MFSQKCSCFTTGVVDLAYLPRKSFPPPAPGTLGLETIRFRNYIDFKLYKRVHYTNDHAFFWYDYLGIVKIIFVRASCDTVTGGSSVGPTVPRSFS